MEFEAARIRLEYAYESSTYNSTAIAWAMQALAHHVRQANLDMNPPWFPSPLELLDNGYIRAEATPDDMADGIDLVFCMTEVTIKNET